MPGIMDEKSVQDPTATLLDLRERILAISDSLSPKQHLLARFFLDHEDVVAFASANEIGQKTETSAATVVRFCRALGYEGYADLQAAIRTQFPQYRTAVQKLAERMANGDLGANLPAQVAETNINNIQQTLSQVSLESLEQAITAIRQARHIRIFASGISAAAAVFAEHSLTVLGYPARACINGGVEQLMELSRLSEGDVVIGISVWRYLRHTVEAVEAARAVDATCIALIDSPLAPLAGLVDHVFIANIEGAVHSRSLTGILSLIDLLSAAIVAHYPEESMEALQRIDTLYRQNDMLRSS